jgi:hypothetical protein
VAEIAGRAKLIVVAWSGYGSHLNRGEKVKADLAKYAMKPIHFLRMSEKTGQPWHPLYLPDSTQPTVWEAV